MTIRKVTKQPYVLFCKCVHYGIIPGPAKEQILAAIEGSGLEIRVVDDLCGLAADRDPRLGDWARRPALTVVACFPRAVRWLFHAAGAPLSQERVRFFNMRTQPPDEAIKELMTEEPSTDSPLNPESSILNHQSPWVPWFPVIDYDRCVNCKQCLNFCLFGVYGLSADERVEVHKPAGCKTNCPACARMCPQQAIIFPKYADAPINGDAVEAGPQAGPAGGKPPGVAPAGDIYERIRSRSAAGKRFSTQPGETLPRSCPTLDSLRRELNIPDDVLASLTPAEVRRITARSQSDPPADAAEKENPLHD